MIIINCIMNIYKNLKILYLYYFNIILNIRLNIIRYCLINLKYCYKCNTIRCCLHCKCSKCVFDDIELLYEQIGLPLEFIRLDKGYVEYSF